MAYNISETSGNFSGSGTSGLDVWTFDAELSDGAVSGNFDQDNNLDGIGDSEANSYSFSAITNPGFGSLVTNTSTGTFTFTIDVAAVVASGSDQTIEFTVTGRNGGNQDSDRVVINIAICVQRGTMIETETGAVAVETLDIGDRVKTLDSGYQPVRWIGSRRLGASDLNREPELRPVRIAAGALGENRPARDLVVSPQHRVLVTGWLAELHFGASEVLVPAKSLVNETNIRIALDLDDVEYFHVLFDRHEIMLTNGAPTESFFPGEYVLGDLNPDTRDELSRLFPGLADDPGRFGHAARESVKPTEGVVLRTATVH
jgi:hypothetical protein